MTEASVVRQATYLDDAACPFFGWYHCAPDVAQRDLAAVVCAPIGSEYTRSHRSLRHLADRLARSGIPTLRFDYHGTGDSPGTDLDPGRAEAWLANIRAAAAHAQRLSGRSRLALLGVRLGGTLAALASRDLDPELLVLWNAPVKGRPYVRELQAIAMTAARASGGDGALEAAGSLMTSETLDALRAIDLLKAPPKARRVLLVGRDDLAADASLAQPLADAGIPCDAIAVPGWNGMMADHQFTVVPEAALREIVGWVATWAGSPSASAPQAAPPAPESTVTTLSIDGARIEERLCHFGGERHLFGVLSRASDDPDRPAILMFNGGAVHHVGPNRIYVTLARSLAAMGFACLRFDLEGIGDSVLRGAGRENHPYPDTALDDARAAMDCLRALGYRRFIALGLCSGAHTAFHMSLGMPDSSIAELILINPYAFYWKEGMSLDVMSRMADAQQYRKSMRDPGRWLKLLRGDVNFRRLLEVAIDQPRQIAKSYYGALCETLLPHKAPRLSRDLRRLFEMNRTVTVLLAEGDPGGEIIMSEAKRTAARALRSGQMRLETIVGGDHTFTQSRPRRELVERVAAHLRPRLDEAARP